MLQLDALSRIKLLSGLLDRTFTTTTEQKLPNVAIGDKVSAQVLAKLSDGSFKVQIGSQPLQMNLPPQTQTGEKIDLVLLAREPRLTFTIAPQVAEKATLSEGAKLINNLLPSKSDPAPPLAGTRPVTPEPPLDPARLAGDLKNTLAQSGLFYESHLSQWVDGSHPLEKLLQEPQGQLSPQAKPEQAAAQAKQDPAVATKQLPIALNLPIKPNLTETKLLEQTAANMRNNPLPQLDTKDSPLKADSSLEITGAARQPVHSDTVPIVRQQLESLENHTFTWTGPIWPGQNMDWEVSEEGGGAGPEEQQQKWQSSLRLVLPKLGDISATLRLHPGGVEIICKAGNADTAAKLKNGAAGLAGSLEAAGIPLTTMSINK